MVYHSIWSMAIYDLFDLWFTIYLNMRLETYGLFYGKVGAHVA